MSDTTTENDNHNPFTRPSFILSAALIVALIAAVLVIAFLPRNGNDEATPSTPATSASTPTPEPSSTQQAAGDGSVCGLPESEETALGSAPETEWELTGRIAVPTASTTIGPGLVNDAGVRSCFAHSPSGALFAAANIFGLVSSGNQQAVLQELAADSPARNQELEQLETGASSATQAQIKGFQLQNYTQLAATVDLGIELSSGAVGSVPIPLIWEDGDWKLNVTEGGISGSQQLTDLSAYIPWSGV
jgi:hypothetical protein